MADAVQSAADKLGSWPEAGQWKEDAERYLKNASFFRNAPACIGVFIGRYESVADNILASRESFDSEGGQENSGLPEIRPHGNNERRGSHYHVVAGVSCHGAWCGLAWCSAYGKAGARGIVVHSPRIRPGLPCGGGVSRRKSHEGSKTGFGSGRVHPVTKWRAILAGSSHTFSKTG